MMDVLSVDIKDNYENPDEVMISDLTIVYATVWHSKTSNATRLDLHITIEEAKNLCNHLKDELENQVVSPSVDR